MIERLKKNRVLWKWMTEDERKFMRGLLDVEIMVFDCDDTWVPKRQFFSEGKVYRVHKDYQPETSTPAFPGYVLCKVDLDAGMYRQTNGCDQDLHKVVSYGCVGYVPKERVGGRWWLFSHWPLWVRNKEDGWACSVDENDMKDFKPATLGWVVFKEKD